MTDKLEKYKHSLERLLDKLNIYIDISETLNLKVSKKNIGWHIQHTLMVINEYIDTLSRSNSENYKTKFNFLRFIVLATKLIPRYYGQSPESMLPKSIIDRDNLTKYLDETRKNIKQLKALPKNSYVDHPVFDKLNFMQTVDYMITHTRHHLKIIKERYL